MKSLWKKSENSLWPCHKLFSSTLLNSLTSGYIIRQPRISQSKQVLYVFSTLDICMCQTVSETEAYVFVT